MSGILPFRSEVEVANGSTRVVDLEGDDAEAVFNALSSDTARAIYRTLYGEAATASEVAEGVETSVQNVRYHLEKLQRAGLVEQVDTWYSSRGNEMSVYAATDGALIVSGDRSKSSELRSIIEGVIGAFAALAVVSTIIHWIVLRYFTEPITITRQGETTEPAGVEFLAAAAPERGPIEIVLAEVVVLPPGLLVFLGGAIVIAMLVAMRVIDRVG